MKKLQQIGIATIMALVISSTAFAGHITGVASSSNGDITGVAGHITGITGHITGIASDIVLVVVGLIG